MIYLDYSATTPVNDDVLNSYMICCKKYFANPNSLHKLGIDAKNIIDKSTEQIKDILKIDDFDIIYTSGASEANNTVIKCICDKYSNRGNKILTTNLEHSSIYGPLDDVSKKGFNIEIIKTDENGIIDIDDLEKKLDDNVLLVSICSVNSETGVMQPIDKIGKIVEKNNKCYFHVDMTQSIGKVKISFDNIDFASFSAHKFYGMKGIGCLIKRKKIVIDSLISGGKSTTNYRSGTPATPFIVSTSKALRLAYNDIEDKYNYVKKLNQKLKKELSKYDNVYINSNEYSIPHILNISVTKIKPETFLHALEQYDIYISTKSACSDSSSMSKSVYEITNDEIRANHSLRISLSHLTTNDDIDKFLYYFDICLKKLS